MKINLAEPTVVNGKVLRRAELREETADGLLQFVNVEVWITPSDSLADLSARTRSQTIDLLERAIAALRAT